MLCPFCGFHDQRVLDSRPGTDGESIRRRRECLSCSRRFTTFERFERPRLFAVKRDGSREEFDRSKIFESMRLACRKRPVSTDRLRTATACIERDLYQEFEDEVETREIGNRVMNQLSTIDSVGYVRFASVYRQFESVAEFAEMVETVQRETALATSRIFQESLL